MKYVVKQVMIFIAGYACICSSKFTDMHKCLFKMYVAWPLLEFQKVNFIKCN